jgi:c-di-GMP-related signal transduction protein
VAFLISADSSYVPSDTQPITSYAVEAARPEPTRFVARQPIFDRKLRVIGYEVLFRDGVENSFCAPDRGRLPQHARQLLADGFRYPLLGSSCVYQFHPRVSDTWVYSTLLPPGSTVAEILESVAPEPDIFTVCKDLKRAGYLIALDDFAPNDPREPLVELTDIIKLELQASPPKDWKQIVQRYESHGVRMLAKKVETQLEFLATQDAGFTHFQDYFFQKPVILSTTEVRANKIHYLRMIQAANQPDLTGKNWTWW